MIKRKFIAAISTVLCLSLCACSSGNNADAPGDVTSTTATEAPTTVAPTATEAPTTVAPTATEAPTTVAPTGDNEEAPTKNIVIGLLGESSTIKNFNYDLVPEYSGEAFVSIRENIPYFYSKEISRGEEGYIECSELDSLGRCCSAAMSASKDLLPTSDYKGIGDVTPAGWNESLTKCSLLPFELTGIGGDITKEGLIEKNVIAGTKNLSRSIQTIENLVINYIKANPDKHCLYRVTPIYEGDNPICLGVVMEALSVEDYGDSLRFCIYCYNV